MQIHLNILGDLSVMQIKILFLSLLIFITSNAFSDVDFELNLGVGLDFPVSTISNFYNTALYIGEELESNMSDLSREKIVADFADMVNIAKTGLTYGGYSQMGAKFDDFFSLGFELGFSFNVLRYVNRKGRLNDIFSFIAAIESRVYTRLDFFIGSVALFTGPRVNMATPFRDSIIDEYNIFGWDCVDLHLPFWYLRDIIVGIFRIISFLILSLV